jgi:hypothetical protein
LSSLKRALTAVGGLVDIRDAHLYSGIALVAVFAYINWPPSALLVVGLGLIYIGR